jgi:hypothetical protein
MVGMWRDRLPDLEDRLQDKEEGNTSRKALVIECRSETSLEISTHSRTTYV